MTAGTSGPDIPLATKTQQLLTQLDTHCITNTTLDPYVVVVVIVPFLTKSKPCFHKS